VLGSTEKSSFTCCTTDGFSKKVSFTRTTKSPRTLAEAEEALGRKEKEGEVVGEDGAECVGEEGELGDKGKDMVRE